MAIAGTEDVHTGRPGHLRGVGVHESVVDQGVELVPLGAEPLEPGGLKRAFQGLGDGLERAFQITVVACPADVVEGGQ